MEYIFELDNIEQKGIIFNSISIERKNEWEEITA